MRNHDLCRIRWLPPFDNRYEWARIAQAVEGVFKSSFLQIKL